MICGAELENFHTERGLLGDEISSICIDGESVWFGTESGISRFNTKTKSGHLLPEPTISPLTK